MRYTKRWEYRFGVVMMYLSAAISGMMTALFVVRMLEGDMLSLLYLGLAVVNILYTKKYYRETESYKKRVINA